jgi:hypothetical protein
MHLRCLVTLLFLALVAGCDTTPAPKTKTVKAKPNSSSTAKKQAANQPAQSAPKSKIRTAVASPAEVLAESRRIAAAHVQFDCENYLRDKVQFCRTSMRRDVEEFNKVAASMIQSKKYSSQLSAELSAARSNLDNRQDQAASPHPKLAGLDKIQKELRAAVAAYEKCLHDVYEPLNQAIEARQFEGDAPVEALEQAIADGTAALEAWEKPLLAAEEAWKKHGQAEIEALVVAGR